MKVFFEEEKLFMRIYQSMFIISKETRFSFTNLEKRLLAR